MSKNQNLRIQCEYLISSLELFKSSALLACNQCDGHIDKNEDKYVKKLNTKIDALIKQLRESP